MSVWDEAVALLNEGEPLALMLVVESEGSAPGKLGFKMLVRANGAHIGTIGGGGMEYRLVEAALAAMAEGRDQPELIRREHREQAPENLRSGMICSGSQTIVRLVLRPEQAGLLAAARTLVIDFRGLRASSEEEGEGRFQQDGDGWVWREAKDAYHTVYVVGGGHVGAALCRVLALTDFRVINIDHREEVATFVTNKAAHTKICCPYEEMGCHLQAGPRSYAVVVTTAFTTDVAALLGLSAKTWRFVGLMGSLAKIKRIHKELADRGVDPTWIQAIQAPVGVGIANRTPAEIAVSIAAQLIHHRHTGAVFPQA